MVAQADHVEWVVVDSEVDALILEHSLIQAHLPRFNVRLKDDKSYPWLAVTLNEEWPRPAVVPGRKRKGVRYFGPYGNAGAIRATLDLLRAQLPGAHVLGHQVQAPRAAGPALPPLRHRPLLGPVRRRRGPRPAYDGYVERPHAVPLAATPSRCWPGWRPRCSTASRGAAVRAGGAAARPHRRRAQGGRDASRWSPTGPRTSTWSAWPRTRSRRRCRSSTSAGAAWSATAGFVAEKVEDLSGPEFMARVVSRSTGPTAPRCPRRVLVPRLRPIPSCCTSWLRSSASGPVDIAVPQRGAKRALQETVTRSAGEDLARHRLRRAADHNARSKALTELQSALVAARGARCASSATT